VAESDRIENIDRQRTLRRWIIGLTLLALFLAWIAFTLRGPGATGIDDGTSPAGNLNEEKNEKNEVPRSMRQYAEDLPGTPAELRAA